MNVQEGSSPTWKRVQVADDAFDFWYPSWDSWSFRRTLAYWISVLYMEGSMLFIFGAAFSIAGTSNQTALVTIPYFVGGIAFLFGAIAGTLELKDVCQVSGVWLFKPSKMKEMSRSVSWHGIIATALYLFGAAAFHLNTLLGFFTVSRAVEWFPATVGSLCFVVGGVLEVLRNDCFTKFENSAGQWVSISNAVGGLLFLIAATTGINSGLSHQVMLWAVDFPYLIGSIAYLIGSIISVWMWKTEQYGLSKLPEINLGPVRKEPLLASIELQEQYGCGRSKPSQIPFLVMYITNAVGAVALLALALTEKNIFSSFWSFFSSTVLDNLLNLALSHTILILGSVLHHTPTANPHRWMLIMMRIILFLLTVLSWIRVVEKTMVTV